MVIAKAEKTVAAKTDDRRIMGPVLVGVQCIPDELASSEFADGFASLSAAILRAGVLPLAKMADSVRKWERFEGNNQFCCDGRLMTAKQFFILVFLVILFGVLAILFFAFE